MGKAVEFVTRLKALGQGAKCSHLDQIQELEPRARVCEECVKTGDGWVHLRMCMVCGKVGCCDDSKNKHATKHYHATHHPIIRSLEEGETWMWCYDDKAILFAS